MLQYGRNKQQIRIFTFMNEFMLDDSNDDFFVLYKTNQYKDF